MSAQASARASRIFTLALVLTSCGISSTAAAQSASLYLGASGMFSTQRGHRQGSAPSLPTTGAGGSAIGLTVESGVRVSSRVALGAELSLPARFTAVQQTDYTRVFQQESRHRDLMVSGVIRTTIGTGGVRLGLVGGGGLVQEHTSQRQRDAGRLPTFPPEFGPYSDPYSFSRWTIAALAGADAEIAIGSRFAVVPQLRVHVVRRTQDPSEPGWALGLNTLVIRPAFGARVTFR